MLARAKLDPGHCLFTDLEQIRKVAERSAALTRQLLAFARKQIVAPEVLDLNQTMEGMLRMLQRLIGEDIYLIWVPGGGLVAGEDRTFPTRSDFGQSVRQRP